MEAGGQRPVIDKTWFTLSQYDLFWLESTAHEELQFTTDNSEWNQLTQFTELTQLRLDFVLSSAECRLQSQPGNARVCYPRRDRNTDLI
jgi:hypothetical protein